MIQTVVTQVFPLHPEIIYDAIYNDSLMQGLLGEYHLKSSTNPEVPLAIVTPGADLPAMRKVTGIECIIHDVGTMRRMDFLDGTSNRIPTWNVYLICWPGANGNDLMSAARRLMQMFGGATVVETVAVAQGLGATAQLLVTIPADSPLTI